MQRIVQPAAGVEQVRTAVENIAPSSRDAGTGRPKHDQKHD